jgi:hypothetical protein
VVSAECGRLHNEELRGLYSSPNVIRVFQIKNNKVGGACGTYVVDKRCIWGLVGTLRERYCLEKLGLDGRILLKWIFKVEWGHGLD